MCTSSCDRVSITTTTTTRIFIYFKFIIHDFSMSCGGAVNSGNTVTLSVDTNDKISSNWSKLCLMELKAEFGGMEGCS